MRSYIFKAPIRLLNVATGAVSDDADPSMLEIFTGMHTLLYTQLPVCQLGSVCCCLPFANL